MSLADGLSKAGGGARGLSRSRGCCLGNDDFRQEKEVKGKMDNLFQSRCDEGKG